MSPIPKKAIAIGLLIGIVNAASAVLSSTGAGHGSGDPFAAPIFFGIGMYLWILAPLIYCCYAYIAKNKLRSVGITVGIIHYLSAIAIIAWTIHRNDHSRAIAAYVYEWPFLLVTMYLPFILANMWYWKTLLNNDNA